MKKEYLKAVIFILTLSFVFLYSWNDFENKKNQVNLLKEKHQNFLENSPFKETQSLPKEKRKALGLPPNAYNEQMWELTMNPNLGMPTPIMVAELQKELRQKRENDLIQGRVPGDAMDNIWIERGPNNVGGRTRALMFDPNDTTDETVFAGGVNGGVWKNTNISNAASQWVRVGIPENLAVSSITYDPNNTNIFYVGTGESYVGHTDGSVNGDGIWKSTDGGDTWTNIFGGSTGVSYFVSASNISVNSPLNIAGDYPCKPTTAFGTEITTTITADLVLANDSAGTEPTEGCNSFGATATGKIAVIRRGNCQFDVKVKNAENAGAIGVIVMNNVPGDPITMGGSDTTITIPSVMISKADGDLIEATMNILTVNGSLNPISGDFTAVVVPGIQHINDIRIRNNSGVSEIYVAAGDALYGSSNVSTTVGGLSYGLYRSTDGGVNWTELSLPLTTDGHKHHPNDIEIGSDGSVWVSTTNSKLYGDGGGVIFKSTDGVTFSEIYTVTNGNRTQIAISETDPNKIYVLAELTTGGVALRKTTVGFVPSSSTINLALPNDVDPGIPFNDFTRGQAFYDLMLEADPINDDIVYTGGIDLFKSTNSGNSWSQFSHWYGGFGHQYVHADQHILAFGHSNSNKIIMGNDGGVYYSSNSGTTSQERNNGYNTSQFYTVGVGPTTAFIGDYFAGGLQDNGTQLFVNANPTGDDSSTQPYGGDGAYTFFDQDGTDQYFIRNYVFNSGINLYNFIGPNVTIESESSSNGSFINPQDLDSNLNILYSNYSTSGNYIVRRYSGITSSGTLSKTSLTDPLLTTIPTAFKVSPYTIASSKLLVGTILGDVLLVENADSAFPTWTALDGNTLVGSISDIEYGQSENEIFVTMHNYGVVNIWYSSDGGSTWQEKDGNLPDLPVKAILQNPLNLEEVLIGTELGVWYTANFSSVNPTWNQAYNGMSNVKVLDLDLRDDNVVFAATHGRGIFSGQLTAAPLDINNVDLDTHIILSPTVISDGFINITSRYSFEDTKINIFNINGQKVYSSSMDLVSNSNKQISVNNFSSGLYIAQIIVDGGYRTTKKIIIK